ncbi:thiol-disulfide isomerase/thioredoxin [Pedobacter metabolipauper]|uniref:Thiol-disulfide isomerase/thioredoxin n=2 Tax=Pedobacter metabolipauper TaxID=425513 RepID=A0A4R6SYX1_9SPHI|nr:thiol-disulfide isomerase/thioredoxin [Pedobacter metabolipauper]
MMMICVAWNANAQNTETLASRMKSMAAEKDPEKSRTAMNRIIKDFKLDTIKDAAHIDIMNGEVALSYLHNGAFPKFETYIQQIKNKFNQTSFMNMGSDILFRSGAHRHYTEILAKETVGLYDSYKNDPTARPADFPVEDWNRFMRMAAYPYYQSYAEILHANGKDELAFFYISKALKDHQVEELMPQSIALYTTLLESVGQEDKAYDLLLKMAKIGKSSLAMNDQLKKLIIKRTGSEDSTSIFLDALQKNISKTLKAETAKKMIANQEAPNFSLTDLSGKRVTLADLQGKIVVIDFWATWCAPCIASMPAMQKLSSQHPEVVFLFIATGENGTDAEARARVSTYVKKNKFPMHVLMDNYLTDHKRFQAAAAYKLTGIPAKIVIDRHGNLRFSTNGFTTDTEVINELEAMIAIAKEQ